MSRRFRGLLEKSAEVLKGLKSLLERYRPAGENAQAKQPASGGQKKRPDQNRTGSEGRRRQEGCVDTLKRQFGRGRPRKKRRFRRQRTREKAGESITEKFRVYPSHATCRDRRVVPPVAAPKPQDPSGDRPPRRSNSAGKHEHRGCRAATFCATAGSTALWKTGFGEQPHSS